MDNILKELEKVLEDRKSANAENSYVASLYAKGIDEILKKLVKSQLKLSWLLKTTTQKK